jgi:hypothetical protein
MWGPHKGRNLTSRDTIKLFLREGDDTLPKYEQKKTSNIVNRLHFLR